MSLHHYSTTFSHRLHHSPRYRASGLPILLHFRPVFTRPTWHKALVLVVGTILALGRRTVTAALKQMGLHDEADFTLFHKVLNRASWSCLTLSRLLLQLLVSTFVQASGTVYIQFVVTQPKAGSACFVVAGPALDVV